MKVSAFVALLTVAVVASSTGSALAQAAGQAGQAGQTGQPKPPAPAPGGQTKPVTPPLGQPTPAQQPPAIATPPQPPPPFPAGAKIAFINPQRIFQESSDGKTALTRVQALTQKKQTENTARQKALQDNQQKLQSSGGVMSDAARGQLEKEVEKQQLDLQRFQQDAQAEIQELQNEVQNDFARKVQPLIDQLAKEKGLQLVFNAGDAGFAWVDPGLDLSNEIIKKLDAGKTATPPKP